MHLVEVESSMLYAVGYDEESQILEAIFNSGKIYYYSGVPKEVYEGLLAAGSKGQYMLSRIIDVYPYARGKRGRR